MGRYKDTMTDVRTRIKDAKPAFDTLHRFLARGDCSEENHASSQLPQPWQHQALDMDNVCTTIHRYMCQHNLYQESNSIS
ncbi:hypothetical protein SeMB42_g05841 [Synchytrium endobioticum]|uniref:Uncharacterized protein n=1 Tax=Synchytrium endobioticum TaxID=286115 RepID=A0A507CP10_9FUNG|nr:hypothetical protein SeMB42_g05841 [Synchytrium endobioticum]